jgi:hypothetical protein
MLRMLWMLLKLRTLWMLRKLRILRSVADAGHVVNVVDVVDAFCGCCAVEQAAMERVYGVGAPYYVTLKTIVAVQTTLQGALAGETSVQVEVHDVRDVTRRDANNLDVT